MKPIKSFVVISMLCSVCLHAQTSNPFQSINKKAKSVSLTNGKYSESYDDVVLQRIGSVVIDTRTKKVVQILDADSISNSASDNTSASRWISTDPHAQKYPSISPYAYATNNPIKLIDPDGMDVVISGTTSFTSQTFTDLQQLSNTQMVLMNSGQVKPLEQISTTDLLSIQAIGNPAIGKDLPVGTSMINDLMSSDKTITVTQQFDVDQGNVTSPTFPQAGEVGNSMPNGLGTGSTIQFDPSGTGSGIQNADGTTGRPAAIGLGHELGHAESAANGKVDYTRDQNKTDPDSQQKGVLSKEEITNRQKDSKIRKEQGVPERAQP